MIESVLCIPRNELPAAWVSQKTVVPMTLDQFTDQCVRSGFSFVDRQEAEQDSSLKQIIPYIVLQTEDLQQTAVYNRQGSEKRLHDLWSLGIGGHINPIDGAGSGNGFEDILSAGMTRELTEELAGVPENDTATFCGVINEDLTDVGSVHMGAVFRILTQAPASYVPGPELYRFQWWPTEKLGDLNFELWSTLAMELLAAG